MFSELTKIIGQLERDKSIDKVIILNALEAAMISAAKKTIKYNADIEAKFNEELGEVEVFEFKEVVETITNADTQLDLEQAKKMDPDAQVGDSVGIKIDTQKFGRISAQAAKQVILQRMNDAEKEVVYKEFKTKKGEVVYGVIRRFEGRTIVMDLGKTEGVLPPTEQLPKENFRMGDKIRVYVQEIRMTNKGPKIILSRTNNQFLVKLFATEVPEIAEGIVEIKAVSREPGNKAKIAVFSKNKDVDAVGACVGMRGARVQNIVQELSGEKIDIIPWTTDHAKYIISALAPAKITEVSVDEDERYIEVIVPDDQLSLAIGRKGVNVRLAAQLSGWKIDIKSETNIKEIKEKAKEAFAGFSSITIKTAELLYGYGIKSMKELAESPMDVLIKIPGFDENNAKQLKESAIEELKKRSEKETSDKGPEAASQSN
ncbi:MAG: transcription termination factor NusA [Deltaproteobacteria bacterium]|nr:transcription termination factor NusA [Deltaproteobacteria bacterium]MCL5878539.1 transcription termination factor NusA [Deltaproteobacteria bacterium]